MLIAYFHSGLTEQTKDVLPLVSVMHVLAFFINQGSSDRVSLFSVLTNLDAPWLLVFLEEPRYNTVREVLRNIRDEHSSERWLCAEGGVSISSL